MFNTLTRLTNNLTAELKSHRSDRELDESWLEHPINNALINYHAQHPSDFIQHSLLLTAHRARLALIGLDAPSPDYSNFKSIKTQLRLHLVIAVPTVTLSAQDRELAEQDPHQLVLDCWQEEEDRRAAANDHSPLPPRPTLRICHWSEGSLLLIGQGLAFDTANPAERSALAWALEQLGSTFVHLPPRTATHIRST